MHDDYVQTEREVFEGENAELHDRVEALQETVNALASALERTDRNLMLSVRGLPVRDLCENLAENESAINRINRTTQPLEVFGGLAG